MYNTLVFVVFLFLLAMMLIQWRPQATGGGALVETREGFAVAAVDPARMPACVARSSAAQSLLARFAAQEDDAAAELRLLVSKLCCLEADLVTPAAGVYRVYPLQFRTSHDMEPLSTLVGRCMKGAVQGRDVDLITEKYARRGHELVRAVLGDCADAAREFDEILTRTREAMSVNCVRVAPSMDRPLGARDLGFWEPERVAELSQYQGVSASPK